jgi:hypothetical protein
LKFEVSLVGTAVDYSFLQGTSVFVKRLFSKRGMAADCLHMLHPLSIICLQKKIQLVERHSCSRDARCDKSDEELKKMYEAD